MHDETFQSVPFIQTQLMYIYYACGLFRATHSHTPARYSHIVKLTLHFYAHIEAGLKVFNPHMSKLMWF